MVKTRRNGRKKCGGRSRKPKYNMKGCASKRCKHYGGAIDSSSIAPLAYKDMHKIRGGSCPGCGSHILGTGQTGGCDTCSMTGGSFYKTDLAPVPAPFVGEPWGGRVSQWPGVDGVGSGRNYFENNLYKNDPQTMMKLYDGGSKSRRRRHKSTKCKCKGNCNSKCNCDCHKKVLKGGSCNCKGVCSNNCNCKGKCTSKCNCGCQKKVLKGGSFLPDFVGLGRDFSFNFESMYNSLNGYDAPVNPKPYVQPALNSSNFATKYQ